MKLKRNLFHIVIIMNFICTISCCRNKQSDRLLCYLCWSLVYFLTYTIFYKTDCKILAFSFTIKVGGIEWVSFHLLHYYAINSSFRCPSAMDTFKYRTTCFTLHQIIKMVCPPFPQDISAFVSDRKSNLLAYKYLFLLILEC